ncbi:MAG: extracellular solute-binding protein [Elainellaceae cyanobacterium]
MTTSSQISLSLQRRSLLLSLVALALNGCRAGTYPLTVHLLDNAVPAPLLKDFSRQQPQTVQLKSRAQLSDLFRDLQTAADQDTGDGSEAQGSTLISLGDYWLTAAIQAKLIRPLPLGSLPGWSRLPKAWQHLVTRSADGTPSQSGSIWGAPYRTSSLVMAYRQAELAAHGGAPADWSDLWRDDLAHKIAMLDSPRAVIGVALKALGQDPNQSNLASVAALEEKLTALHRNVRLYSSDAYLQPLILGDVWVAVGWATDILPLVRRNQRLGVALPQSGTLTTTDLWVQPAVSAKGASADLQDIAKQWISFFWQPEVAARLSLLNAGVSPILFEQARASLPAPLRADEVLLPSRRILDQSSAILPLSSQADEAYRQLWRETRRAAAAQQA